MKRAENEIGYTEGIRAGYEMAERIDKTTYGTLVNAIGVKEELIGHFEKQFGYSREMDVVKFDYTYVYNLGILDALKEKQTQP